MLRTWISFLVGCSFLLFSGVALGQNQDGPEKGTLRTAPRPSLTYDRPSADRIVFEDTEIFNDNFEGDVSSWTSEGTWAIGSPESGPSGGYESATAAGTNLSGNHPNDADDRLVSPSIRLPEVSSGNDVILSFYEWYQIESGFDDGVIQISTDGGESWTSLESRSGDSEGWREEQVALTEYAGQEVRLGFLFQSDGSVTNPGWYVDDLLVFAEGVDPVATNITNLDAKEFPFVFLNATVDTDGTPEPGFTESNFTVLEDGVEQTNRFDVVPPEEGGGVRLADIVFVIDDTGSMGGEIDDVRDNVISFVDALSTSDVNFNLGLITYKDDVTIRQEGTLTSDAEEFQELIGSLRAAGGNDFPENGLGAIQTALSSYSFRPGSQKIFVLFTDATSHTADDTRSGVEPQPIPLGELASRLQDAGVTTYAAAIDDPVYRGVGSITEATDGRYFSVRDPIDGILDDIGGSVSNTYVVRYRASNESRDGTERVVRLEVADGSGNTASDEATYVVGAAPEITLTEETKSLFNDAQLEGASFTVSSTVSDEVAPFVSSARLFYRTVGDASYSSVEMTNTSGDRYEAEVPSSAVGDPGVDFFVRATDGEVSVSLPTTTPTANPFQVAVLPNEPPQIEHTPITSSDPGSAITISADIQDNTDTVENTVMFYRITGRLTFEAVSMTNTEGTTYQASIPAPDVTIDGVEYYIKAQDNFGVATTEGTADRPIEVEVTRGEGGTPPTAPVGFPSATAGDRQIDLLWTENAEGDLAGYNVYRSTAAFTERAAATRVNASLLTDTTYTDTGLTNGTTYYYRLTAVDTGGNESALSAQASATPEDRTTAPVGFPSATAGDRQIDLLWTENAEGDLAGYNVYRSTAAFAERAAATQVNTSLLTDTTYTDTGLTNETTYYYRLTAVDTDSNESALSAQVSATPEDRIPPRVPIDLTAGEGDGEANLAWSANGESDLDGYYVYRATTPFDLPADATRLNDAPLPDAEYTDATVAEGKTYYYRVTAVDADSNESPMSNDVYAFLYPGGITANVIREFNDASGPEDYRLVALPGADLRALADVVDGEQGTHWQAYWDDGTETNFLVPFDGSDTFTFTPGQGFWLTSPETWAVEVSASTVALRGDSVAALPLHDGWNIISNPTEKDIEWSSVDEAHPDATLQQPWAFEGTFSQTDVLASATSGEAYYFLNDAGLDSLVLPYPGAPEEGTAEMDAVRTQDGQRSSVPTLALTAAGIGQAAQTQSTVYVSLSDQAARGVDDLDQVAPPPQFADVSLRLSQPNDAGTVPARERYLAHEWRPTPQRGGHTFDVTLSTRSSEETSIRLTTEGINSLDGYQAVLLNRDTGRSYTVGAEPIELAIGNEDTQLQLAIGTAAYVQQQRQAILPDEVTLTTYPNPARQQATVTYTLPESSNIRLTVYDVLGRRVSVLADGRKEAGRYSIDLATRRLSSGVYFGRLETNQQVLTQKIVVVR